MVMDRFRGGEANPTSVPRETSPQSTHTLYGIALQLHTSYGTPTLLLGHPFALPESTSDSVIPLNRFCGPLCQHFMSATLNQIYLYSTSCIG